MVEPWGAGATGKRCSAVDLGTRGIIYSISCLANRASAQAFSIPLKSADQRKPGLGVRWRFCNRRIHKNIIIIIIFYSEVPTVQTAIYSWFANLS